MTGKWRWYTEDTGCTFSTGSDLALWCIKFIEVLSCKPGDMLQVFL